MIVDAVWNRFGRPQCQGLGADGCLMNTAIAGAKEGSRNRARGDELRHQAGRLAYSSGRSQRKLYATASSTLDGKSNQRGLRPIRGLDSVIPPISSLVSSPRLVKYSHWRIISGQCQPARSPSNNATNQLPKQGAHGAHCGSVSRGRLYPGTRTAISGSTPAATRT